MRRRARTDRWVGTIGLLVAAALVAVSCSAPATPTRPTPPPPVTPAPPPVQTLAILCPANQTAASPNGQPVAVTYPAPTVSGGNAPVQVTCSTPSGAMFAVGTTNVQCTAVDAGATSRTCAFSVTVTAPAPRIARTRFLAFGDSMTLGEVTSPVPAPTREGGIHHRLVIVPSAAYPTQLQTMLRTRYFDQAAQLQVINAGRGGAWAEDGVRRLPGVLAAERPEAVLLLQGANDLGALGTAGVQRAWVAIDTMAKEIRGRGARAFLATLPPSRPTGVNALPRTTVESLNALIRITARGEGAVLVDLYEALSSDVTRFIGTDGLHPTEAGYQRIADAFFAAIRTEFEQRAP